MFQTTNQIGSCLAYMYPNKSPYIDVNEHNIQGHDRKQYGQGMGGNLSCHVGGATSPKCLMYRLKYKGFRHIHQTKATGNLDGQWNIVKNNEQHKFVNGEG